MPGRQTVLIVDDESIVRDVLSRYLARGGFAVETAQDGEEALARYEANGADLILLDLMLPRLDGVEVFTRIRSKATTPVIMLTAKGDETDRVVGLEIGADDYVTKPFSPREVVARVRSVLRRSASMEREGAEVLRFGDLEVDVRAHEVRRTGRRLSLTPREFDLLRFLAEHARTAFSRTELLDELWDFAFDGDPSTVTVHVRRLREKIEADPSRPRHLVTVWGVGYRFDP
jgi:two-component system, OmpR family, response regulator ResD